MKRLATLIAVTVALVASSASAALAVPVTTAFTARIQDANGPVSGSVNLGFEIYDAESAGTLLWEETHTAIDANEGLVYVQLGSIDPINNGLDESVFTGGAMWLEITVDGNVQTPRLAIGSVPYAVHAATADKLGQLAPGDVLPKGGTLSCSNAATQKVTGIDPGTGNVVCGTDQTASPSLSCTDVEDPSPGSISPGSYASSFASCPNGTIVTGGGCEGQNVIHVKVTQSFHNGAGSWRCFAANTHASNTYTVTAHAVCCSIQ